MKVYTPVKDFNGTRQGVRFINGVGETDNPNAIQWFQTHGYKVALEEATPTRVDESEFVEVNVVVDDEPEMMGYADRKPNFEAMTPNELREYAKANGFGNIIRNTRNKEKLIEILRG